MSLALTANVVCEPGGRFHGPNNPFGIRGIDHVALPVRDVELAVSFYVLVLGGQVRKVVGFEDERRRAGAVPHVFMHVGRTLVQVGYPHDGISFPDPLNRSGWPHWAFDVSPEDLDANLLRLRGLGIPVSGPIDHGESVSIYFQDPDGNKLELTTWEPYPKERTCDGTGAARTNDWPSLRHQWRPDPGQSFRVADLRRVPGRFDAEPNRFGLRGIDHFATPSRDPLLSAQFLAELLGGRILMTIGYDKAEIRAGRAQHIFVHVGDTLHQVGYPHDGISFSDPANTSGWPHWAYEVTAAGMEAAIDRLRAAGVPVNGPGRHPGSPSINLYFQDPYGNKLELTSFQPYPAEKLSQMDGPRTNDWPRLAHDWATRHD